MKAAEVDAREFLNALVAVETAAGASLEDIARHLGVSEKVARAQARVLIRQKIIKGCVCGCPGQFRARHPVG